MKTIHTKYLSATTNWPSRLRATDCDGNSITISDNALKVEHGANARDEDKHRTAANLLVMKMQWGPGAIIGGHVKGGMVWVFADALEELFNWAIAANNRLEYQRPGGFRGFQFGGNSHLNPVFKNAAKALGLEIP